MSIEIEKPVKNDLEGFISVKLKDGRTFEEFCSRFIPNYEVNRYEALAIRFFLGNEMSITFYAKDNGRADSAELKEEKFPVKKFKVTDISMADMLSFIEECNFTLTTGKYPLDEMQVMNK